MTSSAEKSIDVNVPVRTAYNQWTQFESFPQFMEGITAVHQLDDDSLHWHATIAGKDEEWYADITEQVPDKRIAWRSRSGPMNAGSVDFHRIDDNTTRITLTMDYKPESFTEKVGDMIGLVDRRIEGDLERFKNFIESRGHETGAWRGEIENTDERPI